MPNHEIAVTGCRRKSAGHNKFTDQLLPINVTQPEPLFNVVSRSKPAPRFVKTNRQHINFTQLINKRRKSSQPSEVKPTPSEVTL